MTIVPIPAANNPIRKIGVFHVLALIMGVLMVASYIQIWKSSADKWESEGVSPFGQDLKQHYVAGEIVREGNASKLYRDSHLLKQMLGDENPAYSFDYLYSPLIAYMAAYASLIDFKLFSVIWFLISLTLIVSAIFRMALDSRDRLSYFPILASPAAYYALALGQTAALSLFLLILSGYFLKKERLLLAGLILSCTFYKPQMLPFIYLPFLWMREWWKFIAGAVMGTLLWQVLSIVVGGWDLYVDWLRVMWASAHHGIPHVYSLNITWSGLLAANGLPSFLGVLAGILVLLGVGWSLRSKMIPKDEMLYLATAISLPFFPYALSYESLLMIPLVLTVLKKDVSKWIYAMGMAIWLMPILCHQLIGINVAFSAPLWTFCLAWIALKLIHPGDSSNLKVRHE